MRTQLCFAVTSLVIALVHQPAIADPPYGDDFDAPDSFETAVLIPTEVAHYASFISAKDSDFYKFSVAQGQDIYVGCWHFAVFRNRTAACTAALMDPDGNPAGRPLVHGSAPDATYLWLTIDAEDAGAGDWRLQAHGGNDSTYAFSVTLSQPANAPPPAQAGGSGGLINPAVSFFLGVIAMLRKGRKWRMASVALLAACACKPASADPPYGDDFDAPATFDEAVLIAPEASYSGTTGSVGDVDYYKFTVVEGQDIHFDCYLVGTWIFVPPYYYYNQDCVSTLIDPEGNERNSNPLVNPVSSPYFEGASAGEWRVRIENGVPNNSATPSYLFGVYLDPAAASSDSAGSLGGGSGGGPLSPVMSLLFGIAALAGSLSSHHTRRLT